MLNVTSREKVQKFIEDSFHLERFTIKEFPALPGGVILIDENHEDILVYYDISTGHIRIKEKK